MPLSEALHRDIRQLLWLLGGTMGVSVIAGCGDPMQF